jgi:hypothetical protein
MDVCRGGGACAIFVPIYLGLLRVGRQVPIQHVPTIFKLAFSAAAFFSTPASTSHPSPFTTALLCAGSFFASPISR